MFAESPMHRFDGTPRGVEFFGKGGPYFRFDSVVASAYKHDSRP